MKSQWVTEQEPNYAGRRWRWGVATRLAAALMLVALWGGRSTVADDALVVDSPMLQDPPCVIAPLYHTFSDQLIVAWRNAMKHHDSELMRASADTVAIAYQRGMHNVAGVQQVLVELLAAPEQDMNVRRAAAHTLVVLNAREQAELLRKTAAAEGLEVASFVEPALARWQDKSMQAEWLERLNDGTKAQLWRLLAIQCLVELKATEARDPLLKLAQDEQASQTLRMAAAQGLGQLVESGLVADVRQLLARERPGMTLHHLLGVVMLARHSDEEAVKLLRELAVHEQPAVIVAALQRLYAINPKHTYDLALNAVKHADAEVRRAGIRSLTSQGDAAAIRALTPLLNDPHPDLRHQIAVTFAEFARHPALRGAVLEGIDSTLAGNQWRSLEQALLLGVVIDHKAIAGRAVELMSHGRPEVAITACWTLRRLKIPELLPKMLEHAQKQHVTGTMPNLPLYMYSSIDQQLAQIFQAFGESRYEPAEELMRKFVPKDPTLGTTARAAACWSLGYLYEGQAPDDLAGQFSGRLADVDSPLPEMVEVRRMCAVGLGRMKAKQGLPVLKTFADLEGLLTEPGIACWWAIEQLGEGQRPPPPDRPYSLVGWFLMPLTQ